MGETKILKFNKTGDGYVDIADRYTDNGDVVGAIVMLRNAISKNPKNLIAMEKLADIYSDENMYELAINVWFNYLSVCKASDRNIAYGGLGINYYCLGKNAVAAYYMNKQLSEGANMEITPDDDLSDLDLSQLLKKKKFSFLKDVKENEYKKICDELHEEALKGNLDKALELLNKIPEDSPSYPDGLNHCALAFMFNDDGEKAIEYSEKVLKCRKNDFDALCNLSTLYHYAGKGEKSAYYASEAEKEVGDNEGRIYHIASSFCEQAKYEKALKYLKMLLEWTPYDDNVLYLLGITYYNLCDFENALDSFRKIYQISGDRRIIGYYIDLSINELNRAERAKKVKPLFYTFQIPADERKKRLQLIDFALKERRNSVGCDFAKCREIFEALDWCYSTKEPDLENVASYLIVSLPVRPDMKYIRKILLDAAVSDSAKKTMMKTLILIGFTGHICFVYSNFYKSVFIDELDILNDSKGFYNIILDAYSTAFCEAMPFEEKGLKGLKKIAEEVYYKLYKKPVGKLSLYSPNVFAVYLLNKGVESDLFKDSEIICRKLGVKTEDYAEFLAFLQGAENEKDN